MRYFNFIKYGILQGVVIALIGCSTTGFVSVPKSAANKTAIDSLAPVSSEPVVTPEARKNFNRAINFLKDGQLDKAFEILVSINKKNPRLAGPLINIGIIYFKKGEYDKSVSHLEYAIKENHKNVTAYKVLGAVYKEQGKFKESRNAYKEGLNVSPDDKDLHYNLGILNELYLRDYPAAVKHYNQYLAYVGEDKKVSAWLKGLERQLSRKQ